MKDLTNFGRRGLSSPRSRCSASGQSCRTLSCRRRFVANVPPSRSRSFLRNFETDAPLHPICTFSQLNVPLRCFHSLTARTTSFRKTYLVTAGSAGSFENTTFVLAGRAFEVGLQRVRPSVGHHCTLDDDVAVFSTTAPAPCATQSWLVRVRKEYGSPAGCILPCLRLPMITEHSPHFRPLVVLQKQVSPIARAIIV